MIHFRLWVSASFLPPAPTARQSSFDARSFRPEFPCPPRARPRQDSHRARETARPRRRSSASEATGRCPPCCRSPVRDAPEHRCRPAGATPPDGSPAPRSALRRCRSACCRSACPCPRSPLHRRPAEAPPAGTPPAVSVCVAFLYPPLYDRKPSGMTFVTGQRETQRSPLACSALIRPPAANRCMKWFHSPISPSSVACGATFPTRGKASFGCADTFETAFEFCGAE